MGSRSAALTASYGFKVAGGSAPLVSEDLSLGAGFLLGSKSRLEVYYTGLSVIYAALTFGL